MICSVWLWHICSGQQIYRIARGQGRGMEKARKVLGLGLGFSSPKRIQSPIWVWLNWDSFFFTKFFFSVQHLWYIDNVAIPDITLMRRAFFFLTIIFLFFCLVACLSRVWTWWSHPSSWTFSSKRNSVNSIKCSAGSQKESKIMIISSCCT